MKVYEVFQELGTVYYVAAHVEGQPLEEWAADPANLAPEKLTDLLRDLLEALDLAHENGVYHGDLSPAAIIMQEDGRPVITHFGMARHTIGLMVNAPTGTPGYTPEELLQNRGGIGPWSDLYALGAVFHRLLTGKRPPDAVDRSMGAGRYEPLASRADLSERFGAEFLAGIDIAMEMDATRRWRSASAWLAAVPQGAPRREKPAKPAPQAQNPDTQYYYGWCCETGGGMAQNLPAAAGGIKSPCGRSAVSIPLGVNRGMNRTTRRVRYMQIGLPNQLNKPVCVFFHCGGENACIGGRESP